MPSPGLSRGARLLRRWRTRKRIVLCHPWRGVIGVTLIGPLLLFILLLNIPFAIGKAFSYVGDWLSMSDDVADTIACRWQEFLEPERERCLRFWARVRAGECPKGWRIDPNNPRTLVREDESNA